MDRTFGGTSHLFLVGGAQVALRERPIDDLRLLFEHQNSGPFASLKTRGFMFTRYLVNSAQLAGWSVGVTPFTLYFHGGQSLAVVGYTEADFEADLRGMGKTTVAIGRKG